MAPRCNQADNGGGGDGDDHVCVGGRNLGAEQSECEGNAKSTASQRCFLWLVPAGGSADVIRSEALLYQMDNGPCLTVLWRFRNNRRFAEMT